MDNKNPTGDKASGSAKRKMKFTPKAQPRRKSQPTSQQQRPEMDEEDRGDAEARALLRLANVNQVKREPTIEKKSSVQVTFGHIPETSSTPLRTFKASKDESNSKYSGSGLEGFSSHKEHVSSSSTQTDKMDMSSAQATDAPDKRKKKEYLPPWDYDRTYYPTTLPLRKPYAGNPEILDEEEFGEAARKLEYDENTINPASDLGLLEKGEEDKMLFLQLPNSLPFLNRSASRKGKDIVDNSKPKNTMVNSEKRCSWEEFPGGYMGKMMVYKSGAIKLKLGDILYDVCPGSDCEMPQSVAAINTEKKSCCVVGELGKRAVVTPSLDSLLSTIDLD